MESSQPQQPKSPDVTSGIATTNINGSSDETSEKTTTKNNRLENPVNIQTQPVTPLNIQQSVKQSQNQQTIRQSNSQLITIQSDSQQTIG